MMLRMRRLLFKLAYVFGISSLFRFVHRNGLTILLYHGVAPKAEHEIYNYRGKFIPPSDFEQQMRFCAGHYTILDLEESIRRLRDGTLPPYALAITFDDGYRNFYEYAFPVLQSLKIPATMFLATDFVFDKKPLWVDRLEYALGHMDGSRSERIARDAKVRVELKMLSADEREKRLREIETSSSPLSDFTGEGAVYAPLSLVEIGEMREAGIAFGAHTKSHPILSHLPLEETEREVRESKDIVEKQCGSVSSIFAYPNGQADDWNEATEVVVARAGFSGALTTIEGANYADTPVFRLKRMTMDASTAGASFATIASGVRLFARMAKTYAS